MGNNSELTVEHKLHYHDTADQFAKRLPFYEHQLDNFRIYCEDLSTNPTVHYLLRLMIRSIDHFCLGSYEDCILTVDQFSEIAIKHIAKHMPCFTHKEIEKFESLVHSKKPERGLLNQIFLRNNWELPDFYGDWTKARKIRNSIIHGLKFDEATKGNAMTVLESDLRLVAFFTKRIFEEGDTDYLLSLGEMMYDSYFKHVLEYAEYRVKAKADTSMVVSMSYNSQNYRPKEPTNRAQRRAQKRQAGTKRTREFG
jgi:hypothetical protein